jgi:hypothetical protein
MTVTGIWLAPFLRKSKMLGPVWIRGIYAKVVFSPKYIFAKVGVVWIRGIFDRLAAQD